jgi:Flp pilus assembly protein TadB
MADFNELYDNFVSYLTSRRKNLKKDIRMARLKKEPKEVVQEGIQLGLLLGVTITFIAFILLNEANMSFLWLIPLFPVFVILSYQYRLLGIKSKVMARKQEINKDVLFAGRYLLVKLNSGAPLVNALDEAANSYGLANKYFREIMNDIDLGKPVEEALDDADE